MDEQLGQRLAEARESIRAKYKALDSVERANDPIRRYLADEIEKELKIVRESLSNDEIVQIQSRIDQLQPDIGPLRPGIVDPSAPDRNLFAEPQDEFHFLRRVLG